MNQRQKEILQSQLNNEKRILNELKQVYMQAIKDCEKKIADLSSRRDMENLQSIIYQKRYQQALRGQLEGVLEQLHSDEYATVSDYLARCYDDGFVGTMYDLHGQGIPIILPIDQEQVVKAVQTDSKLSKPLYSRLGEDVDRLKRSVRAEVSRGIATGMTWNEIAVKISRSFTHTSFSKAYNMAMTIARTEGHRIAVEAANNAQYKAKEKGANVLKQWDATLDTRTRDSHRMVDGEIRELDEKFSNGLMYPGDPSGGAAEVCNCRCALLQRARWVLDDTELDALKERAEYFGLDKTDDFEDFKQKYLKISDKDVEKNGNKSYHNIKDIEDFADIKTYLKERYDVELSDDVKNLDFNNSKLSMQGIEQVMKEFPQSQSVLNKIGVGNSGVMCASLDGSINFNPSYYAKGKSLSSMIMGETTGFHPKNTGVVETGSHEMGHILELALIKKQGYEYKFQETIAWNECKKAKEIISEACKSAKKTAEGKGLRNAQLKAAVSGYAQKDDSECLAEAVADYVANGENASILSKEVWKILKKKLG